MPASPTIISTSRLHPPRLCHILSAPPAPSTHLYGAHRPLARPRIGISHARHRHHKTGALFAHPSLLHPRTQGKLGKRTAKPRIVLPIPSLPLTSYMGDRCTRCSHRWLLVSGDSKRASRCPSEVSVSHHLISSSTRVQASDAISPRVADLVPIEADRGPAPHSLDTASPSMPARF